MTANRTALLVIDVQESFRQRSAWAEISNPDIVEDVNLLVERARRAGHDVIWILHTEPGGAEFAPDSPYVRLIDGLAPADGEPILHKTSRNAFTTTSLDQHLTRRVITDLVISGIQTEQCCETTARLAADLGYRVTFVTEATATFPIVRPDTREVLGTDAILERTEFALAGRFARITSVDDAFAESDLQLTAGEAS